MPVRKNKNDLTPNEQTFADEWLIDLNGTRAYKAGYKRTKKDITAAKNASKLLNKPEVAAYIEKRQAKIADKYEISQERALKEESALAYSNLADLIDMNGQPLVNIKKLPERVQRAISKIETEFDPVTGKSYIKKLHLWDKNSSLNRVEKILGMFAKDNEQNRPKLEVDENTLQAGKEFAKILADRILSGTTE